MSWELWQTSLLSTIGNQGKRGCLRSVIFPHYRRQSPSYRALARLSSADPLSWPRCVLFSYLLLSLCPSLPFFSHRPFFLLSHIISLWVSSVFCCCCVCVSLSFPSIFLSLSSLFPASLAFTHSQDPLFLIYIFLSYPFPVSIFPSFSLLISPSSPSPCFFLVLPSTSFFLSFLSLPHPPRFRPC